MISTEQLTIEQAEVKQDSRSHRWKNNWTVMVPFWRNDGKMKDQKPQ